MEKGKGYNERMQSPARFFLLQQPMLLAACLVNTSRNCKWQSAQWYSNPNLVFVSISLKVNAMHNVSVAISTFGHWLHFKDTTLTVKPFGMSSSSERLFLNVTFYFINQRSIQSPDIIFNTTIKKSSTVNGKNDPNRFALELSNKRIDGQKKTKVTITRGNIIWN